MSWLKRKTVPVSRSRKETRARDFSWAWDKGICLIEEDGTVPYDVLWERGQSLSTSFGVGGAHDRGALQEILRDDLCTHERVTLVASISYHLQGGYSLS